jgi:hypothetical protein
MLLTQSDLPQIKTVFLVVTPSGLYECFEGTRDVHLQGKGSTAKVDAARDLIPEKTGICTGCPE